MSLRVGGLQASARARSSESRSHHVTLVNVGSTAPKATADSGSAIPHETVDYEIECI